MKAKTNHNGNAFYAAHKSQRTGKYEGAQRTKENEGGHKAKGHVALDEEAAHRITRAS